MNQTIILTSAIIIILWGIAHVIPTSNVVKGFGELSVNNKLIIKMEWVAEGLALIFIGALVLILNCVSDREVYEVRLVNIMCGVMLLIMAVWTALTGARTRIIPIKICPVIKTICGLAFIFTSTNF
ncbi:MAG: hypothetical protein V1720_04205 [bacterium]